MLAAFRLIYLCTAALFVAAAALVTASVFIAERAPTSREFLGISVAVSAIFLLAGVALAGIRNRVTRIVRIASVTDGETGAGLRRQVTGLLVYLVAGGGLMCAVMAMLTYAILARIEQGFAVFG